MRAAAVAIGVALGVLLAANARADGAFPDGMNVFLSPAKPHRIVVAATFGLVVSEDDGAHWRYVCEAHVVAAKNVVLYQQGPAGELYAVSSDGLFRTDDDGCTWTQAGGTLAHAPVTDAFPDPDDDQHVLALAFTSGYESGLFESHDRGATFGPPSFVSPDLLVSLESAHGGGGLTYAASYVSTGSAHAGLLHAASPAGPWSATSLEEVAHDAIARIALVDPDDPKTVYLRLVGANTAEGDALGISSDGGASVSIALQLTGTMGGFARAEDGTLYVGAQDGTLWTRAPGATEFTASATGGLHYRCLAASGDVLYACGDSRLDRVALAASHDGGRSFTPVLLLRNIEGPVDCAAVHADCDDDWTQLEPVLQGIPAPAEQPDAGTSAPDGGSPAPDAGAADDAGSAHAPAPPATGGCGCSGTAAEGLAMLLPLALRRRARSREAR